MSVSMPESILCVMTSTAASQFQKLKLLLIEMQKCTSTLYLPQGSYVDFCPMLCYITYRNSGCAKRLGRRVVGFRANSTRHGAVSYKASIKVGELL